MRTITTHLFPTSHLIARGALASLVHSAAHPTNITNLLKDILRTDYVLLTSSGRSALTTAICALEPKIGDEIILQSFTCSVVPAAIIYNRAHPIYCDIDPNSLTLSPRSLKKVITPKSTAVVFQHTFGNRTHLKEITEISRSSSKHLSLIEDKAHILSPCKSPDSLCAIGSFGRSKWISCVHGGYIATNDPAFYRKISRIESLKRLPTKSWENYQFLQPLLIEYLVKPYLGKFYLGEIVQSILSALTLLGKDLGNEERQNLPSKLYNYRASPGLISLLESPLKLYRQLTEKRETSVAIYNTHLPPRIKLSGFATKRPYLCYPTYIRDPQRLYEFARRHSIYLGNWYYPAISPAGIKLEALYYNPQSTPSAEWASLHIVNLPTLVTRSEALRIVEVLQNYLDHER